MTATEAAHVAPRAGGALDALGGRVRSVAAIGEKGRRQHALGLGAAARAGLVERTVGNADHFTE